MTQVDDSVNSLKECMDVWCILNTLAAVGFIIVVEKII